MFMLMWSVHVSEEIIVVNMEPEPTFKKMETVVKLDSVRFSVSIWWNFNSNYLYKLHIYLHIIMTRSKSYVVPSQCSEAVVKVEVSRSFFFQLLHKIGKSDVVSRCLKALLRRSVLNEIGWWQRRKGEEEEEKEGWWAWRRGTRWEHAGLVVQIFCLHWNFDWGNGRRPFAYLKIATGWMPFILFRFFFKG